MVIRKARQYNQLHKSRMALIRPSFTAAGLQVDAPGMAPLIIPYSPLSEEIIDIEYIPQKLNFSINIVFFTM